MEKTHKSTTSMQKMNFTNHTMYVISHDDFDDLVQKTFNLIEFSCVKAQNMKNHSAYSYYAMTGDLFYITDVEWQQVIDGTYAPGSLNMRIVFRKLCSMGIIPPGDYLIECEWDEPDEYVYWVG